MNYPGENDLTKDVAQPEWEQCSQTVESCYQEESQSEYERFQTDIVKFAHRIFDNKICVVDEAQYYFPGFERAFEEYMYEDEDFRNCHISYECQSISLSNGHQLTAYWRRDNNGYCNEVNCIYANSLAKFIDIISKFNPLEKHKCVYRGHGKWYYDLIPGIYRDQNRLLLEAESKYLKDFIASNARFFHGCESALDYLAVLQHHGFPTRLLDFTENPLVALYMACSSDNEEHGDVIRIDLEEEAYKYFDSDTVAILANLAFFDDNIDVTDFDYEKYRELFEFSKGYTYNRYGECLNEAARADMIKEFNKRKDIRGLVHRIGGEKPYFANEIDPQNLENTIVLVKPKQHFERLTLQSGLFAIFGIDQKKENRVDFEFQNLKFRMTHIIIPAECKQQILRELDAIHINQGTLFGDMDHMVKHYLDNI